MDDEQAKEPVYKKQLARIILPLMSQHDGFIETRITGRENTPKVAIKPHPKKKRCRHCARNMTCVKSPKTCGGPYKDEDE